MTDQMSTIATKLGVVLVGPVPDVGGGAFGAAKLARDVARLRAEARLVRIAPGTLDELARIAERASAAERKVDPLEVAARLLEEAVAAAEV